MGATKQELIIAVKENSMQSVKLYNLAHTLEESNIYFEIGYKDPDGTTRCVYSSKSIRRIMNEYAASDYTEQKGFFIDVWEDGEVVAGIDKGKEPPEPYIAKGEFKVEMIKDKQKVIFEINKKVVTVTVGDSGFPCACYELETVFRSSDPVDCQKEWERKQYSEDDYVIGIRVAPNNEESYHFANIDTGSMSMEPNKEPSPMYNRAWLIDVIRHHVNFNQTPQATADKILEAYGRKQP